MNPNLFSPSVHLCEMLYEVANPNIQLSPLRQPSFEEEGRMDRIREHVSAATIGWISVIGHTLFFRQSKEPLIIVEGEHIGDKVVKMVREQLMLDRPHKGHLAVLDRYAYELKEFVKTHTIAGDWGNLEIQGDNLILNPRTK